MEKNSGDMASSEPGRKNRYLLVVNGRLEDLNYTAMILQRFSYPVFTAQNGQQALDMISLVMPALIITDLVLPDMSGLDLLRRAGEKARFLHVILLLPEADAKVEERSVEIGGAIPCLTKPVSAEDLYRTIQSVIEATPRTNIRIPTALPVSVNKVLLNDARGECVTNLSEHGLFVRMLKPARRHEQVSLNLSIGSRAIDAEAAVLYSHRSSDGPLREPGMSLKFVRITPNDQEFIRGFIHREVMRGIVN